MKDTVIKTVRIHADPFVLGRHFKNSERYEWVERIMFKTIQNGEKYFIYKILDINCKKERYFGDVLLPDGACIGSFFLEKEAIDFLSKGNDMSISIE